MGDLINEWVESRMQQMHGLSIKKQDGVVPSKVFGCEIQPVGKQQKRETGNGHFIERTLFGGYILLSSEKPWKLPIVMKKRSNSKPLMV